MSSMLRQHHVKIQDLVRYVRAFDPSRAQTAEEWAKQESEQFDQGMLIFCLERVLAAQGLAFGKREEAGETYKVRDLCVVVGRDSGRTLVVNITASAYELRFIDVLMLEKARKAILDGKEFVYVAAQPSQPLTEAKIREIEGLGAVYAQGGSRRSLTTEGSTVQEPATALLSALGVKLVQTNIGKQVLDIGSICHMLFTAETRQDDRNKLIVKQSFIPVLNSGEVEIRSAGNFEDQTDFPDLESEQAYSAASAVPGQPGDAFGSDAGQPVAGASALSSDPVPDLQFSFERTEISTDSSTWKPADGGQGYSFPTPEPAAELHPDPTAPVPALAAGPASAASSASAVGSQYNIENQEESRRLDASLMKEVNAAVDAMKMSQSAQKMRSYEQPPAAPSDYQAASPLPGSPPVPTSPGALNTPAAKGAGRGANGGGNGAEAAAASTNRGKTTLFERLSEQFASSMKDDENLDQGRAAPAYVQMGGSEAQKIFSAAAAETPAPSAMQESSFPHFQSSQSELQSYAVSPPPPTMPEAAPAPLYDSIPVGYESGASAAEISAVTESGVSARPVSPSAFSALTSGSGFSAVPANREYSSTYKDAGETLAVTDSSINAWTPPPIARSGANNMAISSGAGDKSVEPTAPAVTEPETDTDSDSSWGTGSLEPTASGTEIPAVSRPTLSGTDYAAVPSASAGTDYAPVSVSPQGQLSSSGTGYGAQAQPTSSGSGFSPVSFSQPLGDTDYGITPAAPDATAISGAETAASHDLSVALAGMIASGSHFAAVPKPALSVSEPEPEPPVIPRPPTVKSAPMPPTAPPPVAPSPPAPVAGPVREGSGISNAVFQEPKLVMSEMATLMNRLEQQVAKAGKKLNGRAEEIKQRLNLAVAELVSSAAEVEKGSQQSIMSLSAKQTKRLDDASEEVRLKVSDNAAQGRYTIKQLLQLNQTEVEDSKSELYESLRDICKQFRGDTEVLTRSGQETLNKLVADRTVQLEVLINSIVERLDENSGGSGDKLKARFERFRERMAEEAASVVRSLERNVRSMTEEIDGSWDRASDKLKSSKAEFELTIHHSVRTAQLNISSTTRRILSETLIPRLRERRVSLRSLANELSRKFAVESDRQANGQLLGLESSLGAARQQLQMLVEECISSIDTVGRAQQASLEEIFRETSGFAEKATAEVTSAVQKSEAVIRETELACKSLAESSNIETDSDLSEERNISSVRVQQLRQHATTELTSAIDAGSTRLEQLSQRVQSELSNCRMESTQSVRDAAENGLNQLRDAIQEALSAIQVARDKYMD